MASNYYTALVRQDDGSAFGISFVDMDGAFAATDDEDTVMDTAIRALAQHVAAIKAEDWAVPTPIGTAAARQRDDVREALAAGAWLISVPLIDGGAMKKRVQLVMESDVLDTVDSRAAALGITRSAFITNAALKAALGELPGAATPDNMEADPPLRRENA
ncbi:type II toxin-antitoxin system HicB family antitoxin [Yunchengibacter salinarum]|uniref:type II toxin-antitoxin system HicB family antitoxin n=1 Tax=Yunchengibacter salinarum TaxID=3133399 RepID=UPI0035B5A643